MEIECEFKMVYWQAANNDERYTCVIDGKQLNGDNDAFVLKGTHITGNQDVNVNALVLRNCQMKNIPKHLGKKFTSIKYLSIINCELKTICNQDLLVLPNMTALILNQSGLEFLPRGLFAGLKCLSRVDVSCSTLKYIDPEIASTLDENITNFNVMFNESISIKFTFDGKNPYQQKVDLQNALKDAFITSMRLIKVNQDKEIMAKDEQITKLKAEAIKVDERFEEEKVKTIADFQEEKVQIVANFEVKINEKAEQLAAKDAEIFELNRKIEEIKEEFAARFREESTKSEKEREALETSVAATIGLYSEVKVENAVLKKDVEHAEQSHIESKVLHEITSFISDIDAYLANEEFKDFTLIISEKEIRIHKMFFAVRSSVFAEMIKNNPQAVELRLTNIPENAFNEVLNFVYFDILPSKDELFMEVYAVAEKLDMKSLKKAIVSKMIDKMTNENVFDLLNFALKYKIEELKEKAIEKVQEMFPEKSFRVDLAEQCEELKKFAEAKRVMDEMMKKFTMVD